MASNWWEIRVEGHLSLEDSITWRLEKFGCRGTASEAAGDDLLVRAYLPEGHAHVLDLAALSFFLDQDAVCLDFPPPRVSWGMIQEEDWASSWKQHWHPEEVGTRLVVVPAWLDPPTPTERLVLRLDPGIAFGTGAHATTQLCLEGLEMRLGAKPGVVADIGCGSGILALGAALLGAPLVYAVDNDPLAVAATRSNWTLNGLSPEGLVLGTGSIEQLLGREPADGFVCNILAETVIQLMPDFCRITKPIAWGILSGFLIEQTQEVVAAVDREGWTLAALWRRQDWCCMHIRRHPS